MRAVVLAAGRGTRMGELTNELPKPMLRVQGKPILEHILTGLVATGIREIFIVTGFRAEAIEAYFGDGSRWQARISYGRQKTAEGTGRAADLAKVFAANQPFLLTYGDILIVHDGGVATAETYRQMVARFGEGHYSGVITVTRGEDVGKGGLNFFDDQFCLKRVVEKPTLAEIEGLKMEGWLKGGEPVWYNAGIYVFTSALFDFTSGLQKSPRGEYELTDAISAMVSAGHKLAGLEIQGRWVDVRDPGVLERLEGRGAAEK